MDTLLNVLRIIGLIFLVLMVFNLMILVHEWGHFLAARWRGLKVEKFYIWFGKPIWKKTINGVEYGLGSIPAGGFVALPQMAPMEAIEGRSDSPREALPPITPLDKIIVAFAGPLFSFLLAVFFAVVVWRVGKPEYEIDVEKRIGYVVAGSPAESAGLKVHDEILNINGKHVRGFRGLVDSVTWHVVSSDSDTVNFLVKRPGVPEPLSIPVKAQKPKEDTSKPTSWWRSIFVRPAFRQAGISSIQTLKITKFMDDSPNNPAEEAGLKKDDILRRVAGVEMTNVATLSDVLEKQVGKPIPVEVERNGELKTFTVTPRLPDQRPSDFKVEDSSLATFGISEWDISGKRLPSHPSPLSQIKDAARTIVETLRAITSPKSDVGPSHLSGFIGIANVYYNLLQDPQGWQRVLWFSVVLNVNLAILNMLPFPVLDGGHITMAIMEWIRRKPINIRLLEVVQTACVLLLLGFMVFISFKDTGDVFGIGRRAEETPKEKVVPKFFPPDKRTVAP